MSLRQSITEKQTITQSIRLGQSQSMKQTIETLRGKIYSPQDDSDAIRRLIHSFLGNINDKQLKDAIIGIFSTEEIKKAMSEQAALLSFPKEENLNNFVYKYIFQMILTLQGNTTGTFTDDKEMFGKGDERDFIKACKDRQRLIDEIDRLQTFVKMGGGSAAVREFKIKNKILIVMDEHMQQFAQNLLHALKFLLTTKITKEENKEQDDESNVLEFLREKVILEQVSEYSSERLLKRFLANFPTFMPKKEISDCRHLQEKVLNLIGEHTLISLGIISPEIFRLNRMSITPEKIYDLIQNTDNTKEELIKIFKQYELRGIKGESIFYNRRFTKNQIPSRESDGVIRDFLQNMKSHRDQIMKGFGYKEFEQNIIGIKRDDNLDDEEKRDAIIEETNNRLGSETCATTIIKLLGEYRYKDTYTLLNPRKR